jgi:nitrous oxide reductase accessory protein NosL
MFNIVSTPDAGKIFKTSWILLGIFFILIVIGCDSPEKKEPSFEHKIDISPKIIAEDIRCPLCGMYPARYKKWQAQVVFTDGNFTAFDGCKHMFGFILDMAKYDNQHTVGDIVAIYVRDYSANKWINAKKAHFVLGSIVGGPMGSEAIPFDDHDAAMEFRERNGGNVAEFAGIKIDDINRLDIGAMKMKKHDQKKDHN